MVVEKRHNGMSVSTAMETRAVHRPYITHIYIYLYLIARSDRDIALLRTKEKAQQPKNKKYELKKSKRIRRLRREK